MVAKVINDFAVRHAGKQLVLMHGACPHPATDAMGHRNAWSIDAIADEWARHMELNETAVFSEIRRRPADWRKHGRKAGPLRSAEMVAECAAERDAGADVEVAGFPYGEARGTKGCLKLARAAGLEVIRG